MKDRSYAVISTLCSLVIGILLVVWPDAAVIYLVIAIGALFLLPGLLGLVSYLRTRRRAENVYGSTFPVLALGSTLLGLWLIITPGLFINILMYILGLLLVLGGVYQLVEFISMHRMKEHVPIVLYGISVLVLLTGILILLNPFEAATIPFRILGIAAIVYALIDLFRILKYSRKREKDDVLFIESIDD
jgi:uncharacterized membrane protein HdeD (DUF308 family)